MIATINVSSISTVPLAVARTADARRTCIRQTKGRDTDDADNGTGDICQDDPQHLRTHNPTT